MTLSHTQPLRLCLFGHGRKEKPDQPGGSSWRSSGSPKTEAEIFEPGDSTALGSARLASKNLFATLSQFISVCQRVCACVWEELKSLCAGVPGGERVLTEAAGVGGVLQLRLVDTGGGDTRGAASAANLPPHWRKQATNASPTHALATTASRADPQTPFPPP